MTEPQKRRLNWPSAWQEARQIVWRHRAYLGIGLAVMLVNRLAGLVLPATSKFLIENAPALSTSVNASTIISFRRLCSVASTSETGRSTGRSTAR